MIDQIEEITAQRPSEEVDRHELREPDVHARPDRRLAAGSAEDAEAVGLLDPVDLTGIYDLTAAQRGARAERGETPIEAP